ncbi:hypothetical protein H0H92_005466 [Tricholoma furcatifolium]|nr:hypothetical protein H0H92_005466 [Tricholoma furcatifolium]
MTSPPSEPTTQPLPHQPPTPTPKPTPPPPRKNRHRKSKPSPPPSPPVPPRPPVNYHHPYFMNNPYGYQPYASQPSSGPPPQPQYPYPMPYYPPSPYQYPHPMMMYPSAPRSSAPPDTPQSAPSPSQNAPGTKRKRKSVGDGRKGDRSDDDATSSSDHRHPPQPTQTIVDLKKRTKTDPPFCQHCKQYGFECTFFLPITETRFKKKKLEEEAADKERSESVKASHSETQTSVFGPTSAAHLLHSQASIPSRIYEPYDARYHQTFEVSKNGDGLITVQRPPHDESQVSHPKPLDLRIERETIEQLINAYFIDVAPILPVITKAEFLATQKPAPILVYSMCLVAAARRQVPQMVFDSMRHAVNSVIKTDEVLSTASIANVQALLILCMSGDCHSAHVPTALSALWIRLGTAIRMAQDLGLHRAESVKQNIELRRRLWGACLISDRWTSLTYGHPSMIDVHDCDARLPSSGDPNDLYMDELVRLSVILGKVPSGLTFTTDEVLYSLLSDIEAWKTGLPEQLKFRGPETHRNAEQWSALVDLTGESIDWLAANDHVYDVWLLVAYAATSCALVQTAEIIALLYEATQGPHLPMEAPPLNPTGGVTVKKPTVGLEYKKDPTRPGAGVFIAHGQAAKEGDFKGIPAGVVIKSTSSDSENDLGEATSAPAVSSSSSAPLSLNDRDRASLLSTSSSFAPPLPNDASQQHQHQHQHHQQQLSSPTPSLQTMHRGLAMSSAIRSTVNQQQQQQQPVGSPTSPIVNFTPIGRRQGGYSNMNPTLNMQGQPPGNVQVMNVLDGLQGGNALQDFALTDNGFLEGIPGSMFDWGQWDTFFSRFSNGAAAPPANGMEQGNFTQQAGVMKRLFAKVQTAKPFAGLPKVTLPGLSVPNLATSGTSSAAQAPPAHIAPHPVGLRPKYVVPPIPHPCPHDHLALLVTADGLLVRQHIPGHVHATEHPSSYVRIAWGNPVKVEEVLNGPEAEGVVWSESVIVYGIVGILELFSGAYLLVISAKTEVGNVIDGSHTVYGVKGVTAIPLVEDKARITLNTLASKNSQLTSMIIPNTILDTVSHSEGPDNPGSEPRQPLDIDDSESPIRTGQRVQFSPDTQVKFMSPTSPSFQPEFTTEEPQLASAQSSSSDLSTSDASDAHSPVAKTLAARLSFWSRLSKRTSTSLDAPEQTALEERESLDKIIDDGKAEPQAVLDSILAATAPPPASTEEKHSELEDKIVRECIREFSRGGMYFAYNFDITRSLQHKQDQIAKSQKQHALLADLNALPPSDAGTGQTEVEGMKVSPMSEPNPTLPLWRRVDKRFWWNESLSSRFIDAGGYYQVAHFVIPPDPVTHDEDVLVDYIIISRRSRYRAGLRYQRRGIDEDANVANFVETETIMRVERLGVENIFAYVQIRGSIPLFWTQTGYGLKPPPLLATDRTHEQNLNAMTRHFGKTVPLYGPHSVLNLAEQHGKEGAITEGYRNYMKELDSQDARYYEYDFHTETKGMKYENISKLVEAVDKLFDQQGYLWISDNTIMSQQKGVWRINCIDCLDRTNVVQSAFARYILNRQLGAVALLNPQNETRAEIDVVFNDVWANNGDAISRAYAGTSALKVCVTSFTLVAQVLMMYSFRFKGDFTRTGKRDLTGMLNDGVNSLARMYTATFSDWFSQAVIDFILGYRTISVFSEFLVKLQSTDPRDLVRLSKIRAEAIATSVSRVLPEGERLLSGWTLFAPAALNTKFGDKFEEKILLLSYDYTLEKVKIYTRVPLGDIIYIAKGAYILSPLEEASRNPLQNSGFIIAWHNSNQVTRATSYSVRNSLEVPASPTLPASPGRRPTLTGLAATRQSAVNAGTMLTQKLSRTKVPMLSSILSNVVNTSGDETTTFAAFKVLPIDPARIRRASSYGGNVEYDTAADELVSASNCKEAAEMIVDAIRKACEDIGGTHSEFVRNEDVVRYVLYSDIPSSVHPLISPTFPPNKNNSLADAERMTSVYAKMEHGVKRLLWLGG